RKHLGSHFPLSRNRERTIYIEICQYKSSKGSDPDEVLANKRRGGAAKTAPPRIATPRGSSSRRAPAGLRCHLSPSSPAPWRQRLRRSPEPALQRRRPWTSGAPSPPAPPPLAGHGFPAPAGARA